MPNRASILLLSNKVYLSMDIDLQGNVDAKYQN